MEIRAFAHSVLQGATLDAKLIVPDAGLTDLSPGLAIVAPAFPGRPPELDVPEGSHANKAAAFPDEAKLGSATERGRLLHFFANHELLAMELMALVLLRFPDAPPAFRAGLARTILEEQAHMRLYLERMSTFGVRFGELPLSRFFWDALAAVSSPLDFVVQMSLTFEQANLDFSAYFRDAVSRAGDAGTAALLDRVYREEIGHVKNGVAWFNRWRGETAEPESDWDAYRRLLPAPLSPRRARGLSYQEDARREAGLSETFIRALAFQGGSRGRPRVVWHYNPLCEAEIARGTPGLVPPASRRRVIEDLEHVPMFLADPQDVVLTTRAPRLAWLEELARAGFAVPDFARPGTIADTKIGGVEPWGWSPDAVRRFAPLAHLLAATPGGNADWAREVLAHDAREIAPLYSKAWSVRFWSSWLAAHPELAPLFGSAGDAGEVVDDAGAVATRVRCLLAAGRTVMLKAPLGTAGTQSRRIVDVADLTGPGSGWIARRLAEQGELIVEPYLDRTADISMNLELNEAVVRLVGLRRFLIGPRFEYRGTYLGGARSGFTPEELRFLHEAGPCGRPIERLEEVADAVGNALRTAGLHGNAGIDAFLWRAPDGTVRVKAVVEVNPRWTMGRVALEIERQLVQGGQGAWMFVPARSLGTDRDTRVARARALAQEHRVERGRSGAAASRITRGLVWTSDPETAEEILTCLTVGEAATAAILDLTKLPEPSGASTSR